LAYSYQGVWESKDKETGSKASTYSKQVSVDSYRSLLSNPNPVLGNRSICSTNRPLPEQLACSFPEQAYKLWSRPAHREGLPDNPEQNQKQKRTQKSPESLYRRAKATMDRETDRTDCTGPPYSTTTSVRKAKGSNSLEK
jgi:hypothetical protein